MEGSNSSGTRAMALDNKMNVIKEVLCCLCMCGLGVGLVVDLGRCVIKNYIKYHEPTSKYVFIIRLIVLGICFLGIIHLTGSRAFFTIYYQLKSHPPARAPAPAPAPAPARAPARSDKDRNAETQLHHEV